jgi:hypothetical protein
MQNSKERIAQTAHIVGQAANQYGLITVEQLTAIGLTRKAIRYRVDRRELEMLDRRVYGLPGRAETFESRTLHALLRIKASAITDRSVAAAGFTALALHGLSLERDTIELVETRGRHRTYDNCIVHRSAGFDETDCEIVSGIPCASIAFALFQVSGRMTESSLRGLIRDALQSQRVSLHELQLVVDKCGSACTRQTVMFQRLIDERIRLAQLEKAESVLEERWVNVLIRAGVEGFVLQHRVTTPKGERRIDIAFPERKFGIEIDGFRYHSSADHFHRDRSRDLDLRLVDWDLLHVSAATSEQDFLTAVFAALGQRWHGSAAPRIDTAAGHRPHGGRKSRDWV